MFLAPSLNSEKLGNRNLEKTQKEIKYLAKNLKKLKQCKFLWLSQQGSTPSHLKKYLKMGTGRPPRHTTDLGTLC